MFLFVFRDKEENKSFCYSMAKGLQYLVRYRYCLCTVEKEMLTIAKKHTGTR